METISGRSGEAERDDQVPGSVVKTEVGSPEQSLTVSIKEEVMTTDIQAFNQTGMVQDTFVQGDKSLHQLNENMDYGVGAEDRDIKPLVDKPFPVALYHVDRTNSRPMSNSSSPDNTECQLSLGHVDTKDTGRTESLNIADTSCADYSNTKDGESIHGEKLCRCTVCAYTCVDKGNLRKHMRTHTGEKPYKCSSCAFRTAHQRSLQKHLQTHTGEKPHKCSSCPYRTAHLSNLQHHVQIHSGEKPYKCTVCPYSCALKSNLSTHMRTHTGEKPYKCASCSYSCSRKANLIDHQWRHTGEKRFKCSLCQFSSAYQRNLQTHHCKHPPVKNNIDKPNANIGEN